jgi:hypothetical protein
MRRSVDVRAARRCRRHRVKVRGGTMVMMIVLAVNPDDVAGSEKKLAELGYRKQEVWTRQVVSPYDLDAQNKMLMEMGVGRFTHITSAWGRGPG